MSCRRVEAFPRFPCPAVGGALGLAATPFDGPVDRFCPQVLCFDTGDILIAVVLLCVFGGLRRR